MVLIYNHSKFMYNEKLNLFFKSKGLKQKEVAEITGYSPNMISRYLEGKVKFNTDFIEVLVKEFPEIDLQYIFGNDANKLPMVQEEASVYNKQEDVINDIEIIERKLQNIKQFLTQKSHDK